MKKTFLFLACLALLGVAATPALAHFPWLSVPHHYTSLDKKVKILLGFGHQFPLDDFGKTNTVEGVTLFDTQGKASKVAAINDFMFETEVMKTPGAYVAVTHKKASFYTKLEKGFARKPKTGLKGVKKCYSSANFMKAVIQVGEGGKGDVSKVVGHELELVPLKNPADLKVGDILPVQVLFKGKPVDDYPTVVATYAGFVEPHGWAFATSAGKEGVANLRILHPGTWLVYVNIKMPYPKPDECDLLSYGSALTFEIK